MLKTREGSVRDISAVSLGVLSFRFTDRWSAFDRGASPQTIPGIGVHRCDCTVVSFAIAKRMGVESHFIRRVDAETILVEEFAIPGKELLSDLAMGRFIPLEWIWRTHVKGKLWERVRNEAIGPQDLGFPRGTKVVEGMHLPTLFLECSTKLEKVDRYLSHEEARDIGELTIAEWEQAREVLVKGITASNKVFLTAGYDSLDGKAELGRRYDDEQFVFVDGFGTQDENRLIDRANGELCSKDFLRVYLESLPWKKELDQAKAAHPNDKSKWPEYPVIPPRIAHTMALRYARVAHDYAHAL